MLLLKHSNQYISFQANLYDDNWVLTSKFVLKDWDSQVLIQGILWDVCARWAVLVNWFQPDDIMLKLKDVLPSNYYVNIDDFAAKLLEEDKFRPFGQMIDCYVRKCHETSPQRTFEIYKVSWVVIEDSKYTKRIFCNMSWIVRLCRISAYGLNQLVFENFPWAVAFNLFSMNKPHCLPPPHK